MKEIALDAKQQRQWTETRAAMLWECPAFSQLLYTMLNPTGGKELAYFSEEVPFPVAATDGTKLMIKPSTFFAYTLPQRVFIVAHEIMHCVYDHCGIMKTFSKQQVLKYKNHKPMPYDHQYWNMATDYVINDLLVDSKVGAVPPNVLHDTSIGTHKEQAVDVYRKIFKKKPPQSGLDGLQEPSQSQVDNRNPTEWATAVASALASAKAQGKLPGAMERAFGDVLEPQVYWADQIQALFARKVGSGSYDWRKPDRRMIVRDIYSPGTTGFGANRVVVAIDTSGSIGQNVIDMFFGELKGILEDVKPREIELIWCDSAVAGVDHIEDATDLQGLKPKGGGGTAFEPVFDYIEKMDWECDSCVYLTDGYGSFPAKEPPYPVIWGSITPLDQIRYPWGDKVYINPKEAEI